MIDRAQETMRFKVKKSHPTLMLTLLKAEAYAYSSVLNHEKALESLQKALTLVSNNLALLEAGFSSDLHLNMATQSLKLDRNLEALESAELAAQCCLTSVKYLHDEVEVINQQEMLMRSYFLQGQIYENDKRFNKAHDLFRYAAKICEEKFGATHPLHDEIQMAKDQVFPQVDSEQPDHEIAIHRKRGKVIRTYFRTTDEVQNNDNRVDLKELQNSYDRFMVGNHHRHAKDPHCVVHSSERTYQHQLMTTRQMQDEQFRLQELVLFMRKSQTPAPQVQEQRPKSRASSTSSSISSISSDSSSSSEQASKHQSSTSSAPVEESSDDDFGPWIPAAIPQEASKPVAVKIDPKSSRHESETAYFKPDALGHRTCGRIFTWSERAYRDKRTANRIDMNTATIILIQASIRRWLARKQRERHYRDGIVCMFYVRHLSLRYRVQIVKVLVKHKKTKNTATIDKSTGMEVKNEKTEAEQFFTAYQIRCCNTDDSSHEVLGTFRDLPQGRYLVDYMVASLVFEWGSDRLVSVEYVAIGVDKIEAIDEGYRKMLYDLKQRLLIGIQRAGESDTESIQSASVHSERQEQEAPSQELLDRVAREAPVICKVTLERQEMVMKLEYEARQLIESKTVKSTKIKRLVETTDVSETPTLIKPLRPYHFPGLRDIDPEDNILLNMEMVCKIQAMFRGFLERIMYKRFQWILLAKFHTNVDQLAFFTVRVYEGHLGDRHPFKIEIQSEARPDDNLSKVFGKLPIRPEEIRGCLEIHLTDLYAIDDFSLIGKQMVNARSITALNPNLHEEDQMIYKLPQGEVCTFGMSKQSHDTVTHEGSSYRAAVNHQFAVTFKSIKGRFVVQVNYQNVATDMLILKKLPVDLKYMVYYLREALDVQIAEKKIQYMCLRAIDFEAFQTRMTELESAFQGVGQFADVRSSLRSSIKQIRQGELLSEFKIERKDNKFKVCIYKLHTKLPYRIVVSRSETDLDYISLQKTKESLNFIRSQIIAHLKVYLKDGLIDYLELPQLEKREKADWTVEKVTWIQARIRGWLERIRYRKRMAEILVQFYITRTHTARITVRKVRLRRTLEKKTTLLEKGLIENRVENEKKEIVEQELIDGYLIECDNFTFLGRQETLKQTITKLPPRMLLIDYLKEGIRIEWEADTIKSFKYRALTSTQIETISCNYKEIQSQVSKAVKEMSWTEMTHHKTKDQHYKLEFTYAEGPDDVFARVTCKKTDKGPDDYQLKVSRCLKILGKNPRQGAPDELKVEMASYSTNIAAYDIMIKCFRISEGELLFMEQDYKKLRFGFDPSKEKMSEINATLILQRATRRWLERKHKRESRDIRGYLTLSGTLRPTEDLQFVYSMIANKQQNRFKLFIQERNSGKQICRGLRFSEEVWRTQHSKYPTYRYCLETLEILVKELITEGQDVQGVRELVKTQI